MLSIDSLDNTTNKIIESSKPDDEQIIYFNNKDNYQNTVKNSPIIIKRDLVREFMLRNYPPPAILQPNHLTYLQNLQNSDMIMNSELCDNVLNGIIVGNAENEIIENEELKEHPQLLFEIEMEEHEDDHESDQDKEDFAKYLLNESLLSQRSKEIDKERNSNSCSLRSQLPPLNGVVRTTINNESECRLIGNVNPNIAKTWQQLNSNANSTFTYNKIGKYCNNKGQKNILTRSISNNSDESEKILFYQQVYENKENFQVNKVKYSREDLSIEAEEDEEDEVDEYNNSIESYFDSIENDIGNDVVNETTDRNELQFNYDNEEFSDEEQFNDPVLNNEQNDNIISYSNQEGGEQMADINSFERRKYIYTNWSLENDSYV